MNKKISKIIIAVLVLAVAVGFGAYFYKKIISDINGSDKSEGSEYTLVIESQDFQYEISKMLMNNGVVVDDSLWSLWMDKHYPDFTYINGEYYLNSNMSYEDIGEEFKKHHSTVMYNIEQIEKEMKTNSKLARQVNDIINNIKGEQ